MRGNALVHIATLGHTRRPGVSRAGGLLSTPNTWGPGLESLADSALTETNRHWTLARALSDVVHGINNALQVMSGSAELLEHRLAADVTTCERLQAIRVQAERAAAAVTDLLAYARGGTAEPTPTDLSRLLDVALSMRAHSLSRLRILTPKSASSGECVLALVPPGDCVQLLLNVLLLLEPRVAGHEHASLATTCLVSGSTVRVRLQASGGGWTGDPWGESAEPVPGPLWRVIDLLATAVGGTAALVHADGAPGVELTVPAAGLPGA